MAKRRRTPTQVHRHIEHRAAHHAHQLALGLLQLVMQPTQHAFGGAAVVVLHKVDLQAGGLIEDLLMITQIEDGKLRPRPEHTNIRDVALHAARDIDIESRVEIDPNLHVRISYHHLLQILVNYVKNAQKYGRSPVVLSAHAADQLVTIDVADAGDGVDPAFEPHLFERFSQADYRETGKVRGVGLGLSIVDALATTYGGTAGYRPNTPNGSIFYVSLPLSAGDSDSV